MPGKSGETTFMVAFCWFPWPMNSCADHGDIGIGLSLAVEGVGVAQWKPTNPLPSSIALSSFALQIGRDHVAGGVEGNQVELVQIAVENALLRPADDLKARLGAELREDLLGCRRLPPLRLTTE